MTCEIFPQLIAAGEVTDAGMVLILLLGACVMFLLEVCTPSFGILALMGVLAEAGAVYYGFRISSGVGFFVLLGVIIGTPAYLYFMVRLLPNTPLGKKLFLKDAPDATGAAAPQSDELSELVGKTGLADCDLRPAGVVRIEGKRVIARAEREMIDKGSEIRVIKAYGTDVVVRAMRDTTK